MKPGFSVLRFVLKRGPDGQLTQEVRRCGEFGDVEQAFDTAKYLANEGPVAVPTPPATGAVVASGRWGQFTMSLLLANGIDIDGSINPATNGWAGDAFVTWTSGAQRCIRIDTRSDTPAQSTALRGALSTAGHSSSMRTRVVSSERTRRAGRPSTS